MPMKLICMLKITSHKFSKTLLFLLQFYGEYTNSPLYETDPRYLQLGFTLTDLGCCKVINHPLWGQHAYVGIIFTNAPIDHPLLLRLIN